MKMTHATWMKDTASLGRPRSPELKALDDALKTYEKALETSKGSVLAEKKALQQRLEEWKAAQQKKGQDWRQSVRNKLKAVERLDAELGLVITGAGGLNNRGELMIDSAELQALRLVAEDIKRNTRTMFAGQQLTVKGTGALATLQDVRGAMHNFRTAVKQVRDAASGIAAPTLQEQVRKTLVSLFGDAGAAAAQQALGPVFAEFVSNVSPFVGAIKSGGSALIKWGQAAKGLYDRGNLQDAKLAFAPGDPSAAFAAIIRIQDREIRANATTASIHTVAAGAKAAFTAADFGAVSGPAVGAAETLAVLVQKIYLFARDWNEMSEANTLLREGRLDLQLFKTCPLLGCYLIANSNTSHIINMAVGDYGRPGWKFEVEAMVKQAQPVFEKARAVIKASRFELAGMRDMKGQVTDRTAKTLGVPTGKLQGLVEDVEKAINKRLT